jgi:hypothetical protein
LASAAGRASASPARTTKPSASMSATASWCRATRGIRAPRFAGPHHPLRLPAQRRAPLSRAMSAQEAVTEARRLLPIPKRPVRTRGRLLKLLKCLASTRGTLSVVSKPHCEYSLPGSGYCETPSRVRAMHFRTC